MQGSGTGQIDLPQEEVKTYDCSDKGAEQGGARAISLIELL